MDIMLKTLYDHYYKVPKQNSDGRSDCGQSAEPDARLVFSKGDVK